MPSRQLKTRALERIALLSASSPKKKHGKNDLAELYPTCEGRQVLQQQESGNQINGFGNGFSKLSQISMTLDELHAILALCKAAPELSRLTEAERLLNQLAPYLSDAPTQRFVSSPFLSMVEPSPWEALTNHLVSALLAIGIRFRSLAANVYKHVLGYLDSCARVRGATPDLGDDNGSGLRDKSFVRDATVSVSLLGFLEAASSYFYFFDVGQRHHILIMIRDVLTESFMVSVEGAFSSIRTSSSLTSELKEWRVFTKRYASTSRPLGAMLIQCAFMRLLVSCTALEIAEERELQDRSVHDILLSETPPKSMEDSDDHYALIELIVDITNEEMRLLEDGADYLQLGSAWQQHLAFAVKQYTLSAFLNCVIFDGEVADVDVLMVWLEEVMSDPVQMADHDLASVVLDSVAIVAKHSPAIATSLSRSLPRFIVQGRITGPTVDVAARTLAFVLRLLSQDAVITGLYSLGNVLSVGSNSEKQAGSTTSRGSILSPKGTLKAYNQQASGSAISLDVNGTEESSLVCANVVQAVVGVATACKDEKITALALSMLLQKLGRVDNSVDLYIIKEAARLAVTAGSSDLKALLRLYSKFCHDGVLKRNVALLEAVSTARVYLARNLHQDSPLFQVYHLYLLESIVSKGDVHERESAPKAEVDFVAQEIVQLLRPWAILTSAAANRGCSQDEDETIENLQREAWFNLVVHGITPGTEVYHEHLRELRTLAVHSSPLIPEDRVDQVESDIELNTVLRRGMNAQHTAEMKRRLTKLLSSHESQVKALTYPRVIFLSAAYMVETLRAESGRCASMLTYFVDPSVTRSEVGSCMNAISDQVLAIYLRRTLNGCHTDSYGPLVAKELASVLKSCCHRVFRVQQIATSFADRLINQIPSSLCQKSSLFTLLELLTILWSSCLEAEIDEYEWKSAHSSALGKVSLQLSDDYDFRKTTLEAFHRRSRVWMMMVINIAPLDVKGLLQTYLSEYDDDGAYGHVSLGRSFALEMGSSIPTADQRLGAIPRDGQSNINTGSDFIAQYTTRQEYRYADPLPDHDPEWMRVLQVNGAADDAIFSHHRDVAEVQSILAFLSARISQHKYIAIGELRDVLRRAAALLCRSKVDHGAIVHYLVDIPFTLFSKQAIKLGISLWLGVINENPRMEPKLLAEIAVHWERSVQIRQGIFSSLLHHPDPFYVKEEFAPSDKSVLLRRQQAVQNLITPHTRLLQFISSHFNANRLGSPHLRRTLRRMLQKTLSGLKASQGHPLTREVHFHIILFALSLLRVSDDLGDSAKWRLKDRILSAALAWFSHPPRWSFGGNRIQIKAEARLIGDVINSLGTAEIVGSSATKTFYSLRLKQELLILLLNDEQTRLHVWLTPLDHDSKRLTILGHPNSTNNDVNVLPMIRTAWAENSALAIQMSVRFQTPTLITEVRRLLLEFPHLSIGNPEALHLLLRDRLPDDVGDRQLKYLLYWAPVNPITAATYFLPTYKNSPFIIQYAMRALECHLVDVTFFFVPQFVQILRYDHLGYVQQYIVETAKFSQLFAHQIIWNMKANAYKDEDSTIEDPIKPALDAVLSNMIASFSGTDKDFYEREFAFFNEITDISGKLRPFIKRSKAEKKQKIEEELRKIKVDIGVYLPSNPDGVVVGIDRKSGKPLQSHAKAPYMATFRIKKTRSEDMEATDDMFEQTNQNENKQVNSSNVVTQEATYEVFQSAIFKVGDDCRQDVLALQMIAAFRGIFNSVGLDVYVYPYRVTATAPGCGVIDVLPHSISRDMLGREAVNGLYDYFVSKYGGVESIRFQEARNNFVKSMAAYSIISYLLQFKDRHNGNIMVDDAGHILHIDFGFCFDIAPGGIRFERAPFKLTSEMVAVMGGSPQSQSYRWFEELCIKAFLAVRIYADKLCHMVQCMLDSGLPCFKPETVKHFRERFVLERGEREVAAYVKGLVDKSRGSYSTGVYDGFQLLTNGIPY